jgi:co-chaperonin GroES (HSP10)
MAIEAAVNKVIVTIEKKMIADLYNAIRMANINNGSQINAADYVSITGTVVSVPRSICKRLDYKGYSTKELKVGDILIFSYRVVFNMLEGEDGEAVHENAFCYEGKEYWLCDIQEVFGYIRNGQIHMVNGYCMLQEVQAPSNIILLSDESKQMLRASKSFLSYIGENMEGSQKIDVAQGDSVYVDFRKVQHYKIGERPIAVVRQKDIYAKEVGGYNPMKLIN